MHIDPLPHLETEHVYVVLLFADDAMYEKKVILYFSGTDTQYRKY